MKRRINIKGHTRIVHGKAVKVKSYERNAGKDGASSAAGAGNEFRAKKSSVYSSPDEEEIRLSRVYTIGPDGKITEVFEEPTEKKESADIPSWKRKQLEQMDTKLTPEQKQTLKKKESSSSMGRKEFIEASMKAAEARSQRARHNYTEAAPPAPKKQPFVNTASALDRINNALLSFIEKNSRKKR